MDVARTITLTQSYSEVVPRVREALAGQGFGVLTEIDMTVYHCHILDHEDRGMMATIVVR